MSTISASTTSTTAYKVTADTTGTLVLQTGSTPTTAVTIGTDQSVTTAGTINSLTVGRGAGSVSTNTAVGASALAANTSGGWNTVVGQNALAANTTANNNSAFGQSSQNKTTTASDNSSFGANSLGNNTTGANNTAIGSAALLSNTTGVNNTALGYQAGNVLTGSSTDYNTFVGARAGLAQTGGTRNTYIGEASGVYMTTGTKNTIVGRYSGNDYGLDIRTSNNYIVLSDGDGNPAYIQNVSGTPWTSINNYFPTSGYYASLVISGTGTSGHVSGSRNALFLRNSNTSGNRSNWISFGSAVAADNCWIGNDLAANGTQINQLNIQAGSTGGVYLANGGTSWSSSSDERLKDIIEPIADAANKVASLRSVIGKYKSDEEGVRRSFLIAQDVLAVLPEAVDFGVQSADDPTEYYGVSYTAVIPLLVAAIKELKAEFDAYKEAHP